MYSWMPWQRAQSAPETVPKMSESQAQELLESLADQKIRSDKHRENFESLKAQYINQQEVRHVHVHV